MMESHWLTWREEGSIHSLTTWEDRIHDIYKDSDEHDKLIAFCEEILDSRKPIRAENPYCYITLLKRLFTALNAPEDLTRRIGFCKEQLAWEPDPSVSTLKSTLTMHYDSALLKSKTFDELQAFYQEVMAC